MRWSLALSFLCAVLTVIAFPLASLVLSGHGEWHDHYMDATGVKCCGLRDCIRTVGRLLDRQGEQVQVEVQGIPLWLPQGSVHASEDGAFWVCRKRPPKENAVLTAEQVRCVFYAIGF